MRGNRWLWLLMVGVAALALGGCSFVEVQNISDVEVRVVVRTPDSGRGYTRLIESGAIDSFFSAHGGRYTIQTLPNEEYRQLVLDVREQIATRLFEERDTLSPSDVAELVSRMEQLTENLELLVQEQGSCSGNVPDFETVLAVVNWNEFDGRWVVSCG